MNKQAITFLGLFSLILVLAIYYIVVPGEENVQVSTTSNTSQIESLQLDLENIHENVIAQNNDIIASSSSSKSAVNTALATINETQDIIKLEKELVKTLEDNGYKEAYVEVSDQLIKVVINKNKSNNTDASKVIKTIMEKTNNKYQVEVKFITQ